MRGWLTREVLMRRFLLLLILVPLLLASCSQETQGTSPEGLAEVIVELSDPKALYVANPEASEVARYEYRATPYFGPTETYTGGSTDIFGACSWTRFTPTLVSGATWRCSLGYYTQGHWHFDVRGLNSKGAVIISDSCDAMLSVTSTNCLSLTLLMRDEGVKSGLDIDVTTPALEGSPSQYQMRCYVSPISFDEGTAVTTGTRTQLPLSWTVNALADGSMRFRATSAALTQGIYLVETELIGPSGLHIAGQSMVIPLAAGTPAKIRGEVEGGAYIFVTFALTEDKTEPAGYITAGNVRSDTASNTGSVNVTLSQNTTLTFNRTSGTVSTAHWYVDGVFVAQGTSYVYSSASVGEHEISVILYNADGQKTGSAQVLAFVGVE